MRLWGERFEEIVVHLQESQRGKAVHYQHCVYYLGWVTTDRNSGCCESVYSAVSSSISGVEVTKLAKKLLADKVPGVNKNRLESLRFWMLRGCPC